MKILFFYATQSTDWIDASATFLGPVIAALLAVWGVRRTINSNAKLKEKELRDNLDSKSGWRKQLFDIASKTYMTTDDVYRVLSSLRFVPKKNEEIVISNRENFDQASSKIYKALYSIIERKYSENILNKQQLNKKIDDTLTFEESEEVRIYTKFLLKHHWEELSREKEEIDKIDGENWNTVEHQIEKFKKIKNDNNKYTQMLIYLQEISEGEDMNNHKKDCNNHSDNKKANFWKPYLNVLVILFLLLASYFSIIFFTPIKETITLGLLSSIALISISIFLLLILLQLIKK